MATATFRGKIETSNANGEYNTYDLTRVIVTRGFGGGLTEKAEKPNNLIYQLTGEIPTDVSIDELSNTLLIGFNSVGGLQILVSDEVTKLQAVATTTISPSFNKLVSDLKSNSSVTEQYNKIKSSWPFNQQELPA